MDAMSQIAATFKGLRQARRTALMPYLTMGYPQRKSALTLVPALIEALGRDSAGTVRWRAARALGQIGDPSALEALEAVREHDDRSLRREAQEAIRRIQSRNPNTQKE